MTTPDLPQALANYSARTGNPACGQRNAVLFDMDGILYDSMPLHARAWMMMCRENGIPADPDEFFAYEGMTGAATIRLLVERAQGRIPDDDECRALYAVKSSNFAAMDRPPMMPGAAGAIETARARGAATVLVTGSGQGSLLERLDLDYPGAFPEGRRVTAHNVTHGKPHPEPFLKGMELAGVTPARAIAVDNAPLGVESASRSGAFTIGVRTGPIRPGSLLEAGADIETDSMAECDKILSQLL